MYLDKINLLKKKNLIFLFLFLITLIFFDFLKLYYDSKKNTLKYNVKLDSNFLAAITIYNYELKEFEKIFFNNVHIKKWSRSLAYIPQKSFYYRFLKDRDIQKIIKKNFFKEFTLQRGANYSEIIFTVTSGKKLSKKEFLTEYRKITEVVSKKIIKNNNDILKTNVNYISKIENTLKERNVLYEKFMNNDSKTNQSFNNTQIKIIQFHKDRLNKAYKYNGNIFVLDENKILYEKKNKFKLSSLLYKIFSYLYISIFLILIILLIKRND